MLNSDGLELIRICSRESYAAKLPEPFRPKQFSYLLMSLI